MGEIDSETSKTVAALREAAVGTTLCAMAFRADDKDELELVFSDRAAEEKIRTLLQQGFKPFGCVAQMRKGNRVSWASKAATDEERKILAECLTDFADDLERRYGIFIHRVDHPL